MKTNPPVFVNVRWYSMAVMFAASCFFWKEYAQNVLALLPYELMMVCAIIMMTVHCLKNGEFQQWDSGLHYFYFMITSAFLMVSPFLEDSMRIVISEIIVYVLCFWVFFKSDSSWEKVKYDVLLIMPVVAILCKL